MTFDHAGFLLFASLAPVAAAAAWRLRATGILSGARAAALALTAGGAVLAAALAAAGPRRGGSETAAVSGAVVVDVSSARMDGDLAVANVALARATGEGIRARIVYDTAPRKAGASVARGQSAESDPAAALGAAAAALDGVNGERRILWLGGAETRGDLAAMSARLRGRGIAVDVVPPAAIPDVALAALEADPEARAGDDVHVAARIESAAPVVARVTLAVDGIEVANTSVALIAGAQKVALSWRARGTGTHVLRVEVTPRDPSLDGLSGNDVGETAVEVLPAPRALVVAASENGVEAGLSAAGIPDRRIAASDLPADLSPTLGGYDLVVLDGADADVLGVDRVAALAAFVREGGALVALSGPKGLARGSSPANAALRRLLPLATVDDEKKEPPPVALVFVLDRSDSMGRERKWEVVSRTTASAWKQMNPKSTVGLLVFSDFSDWIVPLAKVKDVPEFAEKVSALNVYGGTDMYPAVRQAYEALKGLDARKKHVVLLSDGVSLSTLQDNESLIQKMADAHITVSTVAVGSEADQEAMKRIAETTGGRAYYVANPDDIPRIFSEETLRSAQDDAPAAPLPARTRKRIPALASIDPSAWAWSATTHARTRATSETLWQVDAPDPSAPSEARSSSGGEPAAGTGEVAATERRPLLARGRVGRGRVVALAAPPGASAIPAGELIGGMARAALSRVAEPRDVEAHASAGDVEVARSAGGSLGAGWSLETGSARIALPEDARGAGVARLAAGVRVARVRDASGRVVARVAPSSLGAGGSVADPAALSRAAAVAAATGGRVLAPGELPAWLDSIPAERGRPLSVPLGVAALALAAASVWARRPRTQP